MFNRFAFSPLVAFAFAALLPAQIVPTLRPTALGISSESSATTADPAAIITDTDATLIRNRAEVDKGRISAAGVKYISVNDSDLRGLTAQQELQRLTPSVITASDRVRSVELVIDLSKPITVVTSSRQPVMVGTVTVQGKDVHNITVDENITADITVIRK